ncbi:MAG: site-specific integrase [Saccharofermentans sp.]|nr:site-specific integrase [Saccharofermentans sp.]
MHKPRLANNKRLRKGEYKRPNNTFEYKYAIGGGKRRSVYAKTLAELRELEDAINKDLSDGIIYTTETINDYYALWLETKKNVKDSTFHSYMSYYERYIKTSIGKKRVKDVKFTDIIAFYNSLSSERHLKVSTVKKCDVVLHQVLQLAVRNNLLRNNPCDGAIKEMEKSPESAPRTVNALTKKQQEIFEKFLCEDSRFLMWRFIFRFMLWSGCRVGEATAMRWQDVDFEKGVITVDHALSVDDKRNKCVYSITTPKTKSSIRKIPLLPQAREELLMLKNYQQELGISCVSVIDGYTNFIFVNSSGKVYQYKKLNNALYKIADLLNGKYGLVDDDAFHLSTHVMRHTFATRMSDTYNIDRYIISRILGHKSERITSDVYIDVDLAHMMEAVSAVK